MYCNLIELHIMRSICPLLAQADYKRLDSAHLVPEAVNASIAMYRSTNEGQDI